MQDKSHLALGFTSDRLRGRAAIASFLGVHPETVDRWRRRDEDPLPVFRPGRGLEALKSELTKWVKRQGEMCDE